MKQAIKCTVGAPWITVILFFVPLGVTAQGAAVADSIAPAAAIAAGERGRIEFGLSGALLSSGNASWFDQSLQGHYRMRVGSTLNWQLGRERHYGERGTVGALAWTQDLAPDWYGSIGLSKGTASFHSKRRIDVSLYKKWGDQQRWVTGLGYMNSRSGDDIHRDQGVTLSAAYYSGERWVAEGGVVFNRSNPGAVTGTRGFAALTVGEDKKHYLVTKIDHGKEAYMPVGALGSPAMPNVSFRSTEVTVEWRQWVKKNWGYRVGAQYYRNPYYNRKSLNVAVFADF